MGPIYRAIEQLGNLRVDILRLHLNAREQLIPLRACSLVYTVEVKIGNLLLRVLTGLVYGDEGYASTDQDGSGSGGTRREG